jgi:hypothetical protein
MRHLSAPSDNITLEAAGRVLTPNQPAFKARSTAAAVLGTGWQTVGYADAVSQRGTSYNAGTSRFTAQVAGWYQFNVTWTAVANADDDGTLALSINGSTADLVTSVSMPTTSGTYDGHVISGCVYLSANDYVTVIRYSTVSTTTRSGAEYGGNFSGFLIG